MNKITDISEDIVRLRKQLQDEELTIQKGQLTLEEIETALSRITGYLLKIETQLDDKARLTEKLELKKQKWQTTDLRFKERKATFWELFRASFALISLICRAHEASSNWSSAVIEHEKALLMIDGVFINNRVRSVMFTAQVNNQIELKRELLNDLGQTQIELASKIQFITEEQLDMKKQKDEMQFLAQLKQRKEKLALEVQD